MNLGPDFIGLGAQKAGTSWIYACLHEHPSIYIPEKEMHFFSRDRNWSKGWDWYAKRFNKAGSDQIKGEFSTSYLIDPAAPQRIAKHCSHSKLLVCLRNPVDRAWSGYMNHIRTGTIPKSCSFVEARNLQPDIIEHSRYSEQIQRYLDLSLGDRLVILIYDDLNKNPRKFISEIYRSLEVDEGFVPSHLNRKVNVARAPKSILLEKGMTLISEFLRKCRLEKLVWKIKSSNWPNRIRKWNTVPSRYAPPKMSLSIREQLVQTFEVDVQYVENMTNRCFDEWRK